MAAAQETKVSWGMGNTLQRMHTDLCKARALLRKLLDIVAGRGVIGKAQHPREAVDGVA
jgi:hypothetical protein